DPLPAGVSAPEVRARVLELGADAQRGRVSSHDLLHIEFARAARRGWRLPGISDSTGQSLTRGRTLTASIALGRLLRRRSGVTTGASDRPRMIGALLPASVGGALVNAAAQFAGIVPVNLNFTAGASAMDDASRQCDLRTIVTSRRFLEKAALTERPGMIFL